MERKERAQQPHFTQGRPSTKCLSSRGSSTLFWSVKYTLVRLWLIALMNGDNFLFILLDHLPAIYRHHIVITDILVQFSVGLFPYL